MKRACIVLLTATILSILFGVASPRDELRPYRDRSFYLQIDSNENLQAEILFENETGLVPAKNPLEEVESAGPWKRYQILLPKHSINKVFIRSNKGNNGTEHPPLICDDQGLIHRFLEKSNLGEFRLNKPIHLGSIPLWTGFRKAFQSRFLVCLLFSLLIVEYLHYQVLPKAEREILKKRKPYKILLYVAIVATTASCYPTIFMDRSFVSPNFKEPTFLLHDKRPTLPSLTEKPSTRMHGADLGPAAWMHSPYSRLHGQAIFEAGKTPHWNRYNLLGTPFIGQGQVMFFDPLAWLPALTKGSAWALDLKYILARFICCFFMGASVFALWRNLPSAILIAFSIAFAGMFYYRFNHPAYFGICYMPILLFGWCQVSISQTAKKSATGLLLIVLGNWMLLSSGTIKEAYMFTLCTNWLGACLLISNSLGKTKIARTRLKTALLAVLGSIVLTTPIWLSFMDVFFMCDHIYDAAFADQLSLSSLIGIFDDIFLRQRIEKERLYSVSSNWIVFCGLTFCVLKLRILKKQPLFLGAAIGMTLPLSLTFEILPASLLAQIPLISGLHHVHDIFGSALVIALFLLAGGGFSYARYSGDRWWIRPIPYIGIYLILLFGFLLQKPPSDNPTDHSNILLQMSTFAWRYSLALGAGGWIFVCFWERPSKLWTTALLTVALAVLLWRYAQNGTDSFQNYTMRPPKRTNLVVDTVCMRDLDRLRGDTPSRVMGIMNELHPGYTASLGWETSGGADSLMPPYHHELSKAMGFSYVWEWRMIIYPNDLPRIIPGLDLFNVRYIVSSPERKIVETEKLDLKWVRDQVVYENKTAWPRAFFSETLRTYHSIDEFANWVKKSNGQPFIAMEKGEAIDLKPSDLGEENIIPATKYELGVNDTSFTIESNGPGIVALHESYWPRGIKVRVNGEEEELLRVNHGFRGVRIADAGTHRITFQYTPWTWPTSLSIGCLGLIMIIWSYTHLVKESSTPPDPSERMRIK